MPRSPCQKLSLGNKGGIWNVEPECLPLISPVRFFRVLAFFPAAAKLGLCSPHSFLTCLPCFLTCVPSFHSEAQKPESLLPTPRLPGRICDAHFRFRSVPLRLRVLWVLLRCLICIRKTWRRERQGAVGGGLWGPWRCPGVSRRQSDEARGRSSSAPCSGSPSGLTLRSCAFYLPVQWRGDPRCCCCR